MTSEDIIRMARECGIPSDELYHPNLKRFASLVAAAEREACAMICLENAQKHSDLSHAGITATLCAIDIRARGQA